MNNLANLKIVAPVRSKFMLEEMIEAGANEVFVGVRNTIFQQLSFDNRFQTVAEFPAHLENWSDLEEIVSIAKSKNLKVIFMANTPYIPKELEESYIAHVLKAVERGVDSVTISSFQSLKLLKDNQINVEIISGSALAPTNMYGAMFLKDLGVTRITVLNSMSIEEIKKLKELGLELMITGNFGTGSIPASCRLWESPNNKEIGEGVRSLYRVYSPEGVNYKTLNILDKATDCSLCNLEDLVAAGITSIKFIGREAPNPVTLATVVDLFRQWKELGLEEMTIEMKKKVMEQEHLMWIMKWLPRFCEKCRCTYLATPITKTYI
ncbi:MAG: U32 family peptidase [Psychrobacillus sp.]